MATTQLFEIPVTVYYEDTDFTGYVFHANYLKYFDRAREEIFGIERLKTLYAENRHFVVKSAGLEYKLPVTHGMQLKIRTRASFDRSPLIFFEHDVVEAGSTDVIRVLGKIELVYVNERGYPVRLGDEVYSHLEKLCVPTSF